MPEDFAEAMSASDAAGVAAAFEEDLALGAAVEAVVLLAGAVFAGAGAGAGVELAAGAGVELAAGADVVPEEADASDFLLRFFDDFVLALESVAVEDPAAGAASVASAFLPFLDFDFVLLVASAAGAAEASADAVSLFFFFFEDVVLAVESEAGAAEESAVAELLFLLFFEDFVFVPVSLAAAELSSAEAEAFLDFFDFLVDEVDD